MKMKRILILFGLLAFFFVGCKKEQNTDTFTVTLESNGGMKIAPIRVRSGETIPQKKLFPSPIIADGGTFDGWYADEELQEKFDFNTKVASDLTLYAKWLYKTYQVSFVMNGGPEKNPVEVREGATVELDRPSMEGKVFVGWYKDAAFTQLYNVSAKVITDINLYARWVDPSPMEWFAIDGLGTLVGCAPPDGTTTVVIPEGVKEIPAWFVLATGLNEPGKPGFPTGKNIKEFILPQSLERIGMGAFKFAGIESIIIPPKVKELIPVVFEGCNQLKQFAFAPYSTFERLVSDGSNQGVISSSSLEYLTFPPSLQYVGRYTLSGCSALKTVTFERRESPVTLYDNLPGGGIWLFEGYFPQSIRMPDEVKASFLIGIRAVMQDYEYNRWVDIVEGY